MCMICQCLYAQLVAPEAVEWRGLGTVYNNGQHVAVALTQRDGYNSLFSTLLCTSNCSVASSWHLVSSAHPANSRIAAPAISSTGTISIAGGGNGIPTFVRTYSANCITDQSWEQLQIASGQNNSSAQTIVHTSSGTHVAQVLSGYPSSLFSTQKVFKLYLNVQYLGPQVFIFLCIGAFKHQ
ncbi:MAG: hypothetical protein FJ146_08655 [Deltaproteobacteria bacterium]|nr:hypothetical protein [Deltaproteobacteria bacterium]